MSFVLKLRQVLAFTALVTTLGANAEQVAKPEPATPAAVFERLKNELPRTGITSVRESAIPGLYEVVMGRNVAYTEPTARYLVFGHIYDMKSQTDITQNVIDDLVKQDFNLLPLQNAIRITKGNGSRRFAVFSDPDCPYCKKLESEVSKMDNYTMYVFLMPLEKLHPDAVDKAKAIWCSKNPAEAWRAYMLDGTLLERVGLKSCDDPVAKNLDFAATLKIVGTPAIMTESGKLNVGFASREKLEKLLDQAAK